MKTARVTGAGISGLAAAWCLSEAGFAVEVIEEADHPGGLIATTRTPHGLVERAANAFVWGETTARWFERLGIVPVRPLESATRRFIYRDGRPRRWPLTRLETAGMLARLSWRYVMRRLKPHDGESVSAFVTRVAGPAANRWFVAPAMQGVYASSADVLSAAAVFAHRRRLGMGSVAPAGGMGEFVERLYDDLRARGVSFQFGATADYLGGSAPTVVCTNARAAARLVRPHAPALADALDQVRMTGLETSTVFFEPHTDDLEGFGVLFPRGCGVDALGVLFNTSIFPNRGPLRSETWIYALDEGTLSIPSARIAADRQVFTGREDKPIAIHTTRRPAALPVYDAQIPALAPLVADLPPWLALSGNYLGEIGVSTLLARAERTVAALVSRSS
jgi:oxygen-dependent protoporphyrinogen oxidase